MFRSYWIIVVALGLVFAVSLGQAQDQTPETPIDPAPAQEQSADQPPIEDAPVIFILPTEPSGSEHDGSAAEDGQEDAAQHLIFGDGWAQWVMAGTGIGAFFLSGWAVWLLWQTLSATRKAVVQTEKATEAANRTVDETRLIGQAQTRAYVQLDDIDYKWEDVPNFVGRGLRVRVDWRNTGQSPTRSLLRHVGFAYGVAGDAFDFHTKNGQSGSAT